MLLSLPLISREVGNEPDKDSSMDCHLLPHPDSIILAADSRSK